MAIVGTHIESGGSGTNGTSYATGSQTPTASELQLLAVTAQAGAGSPEPTVSGCGLTWVAIRSVAYNDVGGDDKSRLTLFRALGTPSTGVLTIDFGAASQAQCGWSWSEHAGIDTGGTNGSGAVVQSADNHVESNTTVTVTLAAFDSANNGTYGCFGQRDGTAAWTQGTGFTELGEWAGGDTPGMSAQSEWRNDNDTGVDATSDQTADLAGIAVEIKVSGGAAKAPTAPTAASATADGDSITATFTDNTSGAAQHRAYIKRTTDSIWDWAADLALGVTTFVHEWLVADTSYDIGFTSFDADAESAMTTDTATTGTVRLVSGSFL